MTTADAEAERGCVEAGGERKRKKMRGRQKIEIKRIESMAARYVCFSKRHAGLFKKAAELVALCGAHVAVVAFSQAGKPFSFGHPSVNAVVGRYLDDPTSAATSAGAAAAAPGEETARLLAPLLHEYNSERERLEKGIEAETSRGKALDAAAHAAGVRGATGDDLRGAGMPDLLAMLAALERVQAEAAERMRMMHEAIAEEAMMMQHCAAAGSGGDASGAFSCPSAGVFAADGGASGSHPDVMDTRTMLLMGGDVNLAPTMHFAPMMLPPYVPPPPLIYGSDHNQFQGYGYDLGHADGSCHGAAYEMEGYYGTTTTCNFF